MATTARSIGHRTCSTKVHIGLALSGLLISTASLPACGPAEDADPAGIAVSVPDSSATQDDAGATPDQPCAVDGDCLHGSCVTSYSDGDGDGYGNRKVTRCESAPVAGYALRGGDCCDADPGTHPGVTDYSAVADACGGFDRNCDGKAERDDGSALTCGCIGRVGKLGGGQICAACR